MKRLILIAIFVLGFALQGWAKVPAIEVSDWIPFRLFDSNNTYMYGKSKDANHVVRLDADGTDTEMSFDFATATPTGAQANANFGVRHVWCAPTDTYPEQIFVMVWDDNPDTDINYRYYLWRSVDGGNSFGDNATATDGDWLFAIGDDGGTHTRYVSALARGFCHAQISGSDKYYLGEYNVHATRTNGSTNDRVRLMTSTDGYTWTEEVTFNNDGANNNTRHIHAVQQDSETGTIFIALGDTEAQSAILKWNGIVAIPDNTDPDAISGTNIRGNSGSQRYRVCDFLFPAGDYYYTFTDSISSDAERGIWQHPKDIDSDDPKRVNTDVLDHDNASGYLMLQTDSGFLATEFMEAANADHKIYIYASSDAINWIPVASYNCEDGSGANAFGGLFEFNNKIYMHSSDQAGKFNTGSSEVIWDGNYTKQTDTELRIIHPVYWVGDHGQGTPVDTAGLYANGVYQGGRPSLPWVYIKYALSGDRIPVGGRILLPTGTHTEVNGFVPDYDSSLRSGTGKVTIEGQGMSSTIINFPSDNSQSYAITQSATTAPLLVQNLTMQSDKALTDFVTPSGASIYFRYVDIGGTGAESGRLIDTSGANALVDIGNCFIRGGTTTSVEADVSTHTINVKHSVFIGGRDQILLNNNPTHSIYNNSFIDYTRYGVLTNGSQTGLANFGNNLFFSSGGSAPMFVNAGISDDIEYCVLDKNINETNITVGSTSFVVSNIADYVSPIGKIASNYFGIDLGDFVTGVNDDGESDIWGNYIFRLPNIGADQKYSTSGSQTGGGSRIIRIGGSGIGIQ